MTRAERLNLQVTKTYVREMVEKLDPSKAGFKFSKRPKNPLDKDIFDLALSKSKFNLIGSVPVAGGVDMRIWTSPSGRIAILTKGTSKLSKADVYNIADVIVKKKIKPVVSFAGLDDDKKFQREVGRLAAKRAEKL